MGRMWGVALCAAAATAAADEAVAACFVELPAGDPPEWVMLMPAGDLDARDGRRWRLDDAAAVIEATRRHAGATDLVLDYEHQTEYSETNGQPAPAAAWIRGLEARAGAIWARLEWTERARQMVKAREYRYLSPTFIHTRASRGVVKRLLGGALTNTPALDIPALARRHRNDDPDAGPGGTMHEQLKRILAKLGLKPDSEPTAAEADTALARIDPAPPIDLAELAKALGLAATAKAADVLAAAKARGTELAKALGLAETATADEVLAAAKAKGGDDDPDPAAFVPRAEFDRVAQSLATLQGELGDDKATAAVDDAVKAGKVSPATRDWARAYARKDLAGFQKFVAAAPAIVTPAAASTARAGDPGAALTADERAVCRSLGVSEEKFKAARKADIEAAGEVANG